MPKGLKNQLALIRWNLITNEEEAIQRYGLLWTEERTARSRKKTAWRISLRRRSLRLHAEGLKRRRPMKKKRYGLLATTKNDRPTMKLLAHKEDCSTPTKPRKTKQWKRTLEITLRLYKKTRRRRRIAIAMRRRRRIRWSAYALHRDAYRPFLLHDECLPLSKLLIAPKFSFALSTI